LEWLPYTLYISCWGKKKAHRGPIWSSVTFVTRYFNHSKTGSSDLSFKFRFLPEGEYARCRLQQDWRWRTAWHSGVPRNFVRGGGSINSVEDRGQSERESGGGSPLVGVPLNLQMSETRILIRLLRMYFPQNWEFGSALSKLRNFGGGGVWNPNPPSGRHW
jgi:hypothetical protein